MWFEKRQIEGKRYALVLIGSYKLRVCIVDFLNTKVRILWYSEKRQDTSLFSNGQCINLPWLAANISEILSSLEKKLWVHIEQIVCNYPFWEEHLSITHSNHPRKKPETLISEQELEWLILKAEKICLVKWASEIEKLYGLKNSELDIILSRITSIELDGKKTEKIIGKSWGDVKLQVLNITIPKNQHKILRDLMLYSDKKIGKIIPVEYAIGKLYPQKDLIIIDVGATQTSLSFKKSWTIQAISKFPVWIHQLIELIAKNHSKTRSEILRDLGGSSYSLEKKYFTNIWGQAYGMSLAELLRWDVCPRHFALTGWWASNSFLRDEILYFPYHHYDISIPIEKDIVWEDLAPVLTHIQDLQLKDLEKMSLWIFAMIEETRRYLAWNHEHIRWPLEKALKKLWFQV